MGREAMQPVELTDAWADVTGPDATASGEPADPEAGRRWARRRRWALAVAALLVVGLLGTQAVLDARERVHLAHLATIPGVLAPVDASVGTLWSSDDWATLSALYGSAVGDMNVGGHIDEAGERTVRAVRARTGEVVWSTVLGAADPAAQARARGLGPSCSTGEEVGVPRQVVCLVTDAAYVGSTDGPPTPVAATFARLVVLDPATGEQQVQRDMPASVSTQVGLLDGLAVVAWRTAEGHLVVTGTEPLTGEVRWRFESPEPLAPALADHVGWQDASGIYLSVVADHVAVAASGGELWVFSGAGDLVDHTAAGDRTGAEAPRPGVLAVVDYEMSSPTGRSMRILEHGGPVDATYDEQPESFTADDGSVPNLLFTSDSRLHAWDMTTGEPVWATEVSVESSAILLDSHIYVRSSGGHLLALDAATGTTLWEQPLAGSPDSSLFTDGRSLLASEASSTGPRNLVAFAPSDGRRLWEAPLPDSVAYVWEMGRQLLGVSEDGTSTVVLG
jgi:outer membrane protein assembly factor BamB